MKVAMVTPFPDEPGQISGGVAAVSAYLAPLLQRTDGIELEVVVPRNGPAFPDETRTFDDLPVHYLHLSESPLRGFVFTGPARLREWLAGRGFDLVHVQGMAWWSRRCPAPSVLTLHGLLERDVLFRANRLRRLRSLVYRILENRGRRAAENVIVISPYLREYLGGVLRGRTWDIDNPAADAFFDVERSPEPGRIFCAARIIPRKNILGLIETLARVRAGGVDARLRLAGGAEKEPYALHCAERARQLGVAGAVEFLGPLSVEDVRTELGKAGCFALQSFQETAPVSIEEAMAAGVPVAASALCGVPYMVEDGASGRVADPDDSVAFAEAVLDVLEPAANERMSARGREIAERRFRASSVAEKTSHVYRAILDGSEVGP